MTVKRMTSPMTRN
jgi:hypothetical protein